MAKTHEAQRMDEVVALLAPLLKEQGFRKRGRTFNRAAEEGVVQVVAFQMGRHSLAGAFTVNAGVYVREVHETFMAWRDDLSFVPEADCMIRWRLGSLAHGSDRWWRLDPPPETLAGEVAALLRGQALPFLDALTTRDEVLAAWRERPRELGMAPIGPLEVAVIHLRRREREEARRLYDDYLAQQPPGRHRDIVLGYGELLGID